MGLFSYFHQPPDPIVSFTLDSRGTFRPGSAVSGSVLLQIPHDPKAKVQPPPPRQLNVASITFYGHAATANTRSESNGPNNGSRTIYYKDDVCLFRQSYTLASNLTLDERMPMECGFGFSFPYVSDNLPFDSPYRMRHNARGTYLEPSQAQQQPLPPSFSMGYGNDSAIVEYTIELVCNFEGEREPFTVRLTTPMDFLPSPPSSSHPAPPLSEYSNELKRFSSSRLIGGEKSFANSFRDKFSSSTPAVDAMLKVTLPTTMVPGSSFPIYACLEVSNPSVQGINLPVAEIRPKSLRCSQVVYYRALRDNREIPAESLEETRTSNVVLNAIPESQWIEPRNRNVNEKGTAQQASQFWYYPATFEARLPSGTGLSLQTSNIDCEYVLELKIEAEILGKEFEFEQDVAVFMQQASV